MTKEVELDLIKQDVQRALETVTNGLPFAGPTVKMKNGDPIWDQPKFWTKEDFFLNYFRYNRRRKENAAVARNIARICQENFGETPCLAEDPTEAERISRENGHIPWHARIAVVFIKTQRHPLKTIKEVLDLAGIRVDGDPDLWAAAHEYTKQILYAATVPE